MAFENEALAFIDAWLAERYAERVEPLICGSASDYAEYKERVGYVMCLKDLSAALEGFVSKINDGIRSGGKL